MPRTALTVQDIVIAGLTPVYSAANADGHSIAGNLGDIYLHVKNTEVEPLTVTVQTPAFVEGIAIADVTVVVPATTGDKLIGPFRAHLFNRAADGLIYVDLDVTTGVTLAAVRFPR